MVEEFDEDVSSALWWHDTPCCNSQNRCVVKVPRHFPMSLFFSLSIPCKYLRIATTIFEPKRRQVWVYYTKYQRFDQLFFLFSAAHVAFGPKMWFVHVGSKFKAQGLHFFIFDISFFILYHPNDIKPASKMVPVPSWKVEHCG